MDKTRTCRYCNSPLLRILFKEDCFMFECETTSLANGQTINQSNTCRLTVKLNAAQKRISELEETLKGNGFIWSEDALPPRWLPPHILG